MRLHTGSQLACLLLLVHAVQQVAGVNFTQCLIGIVANANANATQNLTGLLNGDGGPVSNASDATSISYSLCTSACGTGQEPFQWSVFSQDFSAWLLPNLALISQLPFGAQYRLDNLMSAVLTVGSPALAGYSLFITLLNSRWITQQFRQSANYPNSRSVVSILSSLQQVPLRLHLDRVPSLLVLPENDCWWKYFSELVDYTHTWSIASATSIAWVVVAYIVNVVNSPADMYSVADGDPTGSLWLWLIPIVVGWLQLSPKCDYDRLQAAYDRADRHAHPGPAGAHMRTPLAFTRRPLTITAKEKDVMSPDELLTPPVFNYSRSLPWASTANAISLMFEVASEKAECRIPVRSGSEWVESDTSESIHPSNRYGSSEEIARYCAEPYCAEPCGAEPLGAEPSHWGPGVFTRMAIASCASLILQWGTVGSAFIAAWFTPTTRMGCRALSYLLYGAISTLIWMMLLTSSILAHYAAGYSHRPSLSARIALALSHGLRRMGKILAIANSIWVVVSCIFVYSNFYDTCYCNSSVVSRGTGSYDAIIETAPQAAVLRAAWIGAVAMASTSALAFLGVMNLLLDRLPL
ncbi:uncharacterized protein EDB91DRAFT_368426 [Suillus paluster]|uniref:uncharacterized protein n=1 Tax=Suillus paluster TaxID=48578 RepID=UPI001B8850A1|nr:uncharacterized protein EDB91DRAFT_368426 [Suillus paluster]KAG1739815.1 hypothetical protein EDB91DRAFT_368426 [Suillus paluster]